MFSLAYAQFCGRAGLLRSTLPAVAEVVTTKPFAGYTNFADCVAKNQDQENPSAYCATIMHAVEKQVPPDRTITVRAAMAALMLDPAAAELLAIVPSLDLTAGQVEVETPEDLHITLAYFPSVQDDQVDALIQRIASAALMCGSVQTVIEGVARFLASPSSDQKVPYVALVDPTNLYGLSMMLRDSCSQATDVADNHGFIPHITLAYTPPGTVLDVQLPPALPLLFNELTLAIGEERHSFPFGTPPVAAAYMDRLREKVAETDDVSDAAARLGSSVPQLTNETEMSVAEIIEKATWTTAFINDLPDSSFLYIEPGGKKDESGKTEPRTLRHFPVKGPDGAVDLPHLRNAIARIPQSNAPGLTPEKQQQLQDRARTMLESASGATTKEGRRLSSSWRSKLSTILESIKGLLSWADYEDLEESHKSFLVFKDTDGNDRWLSISSNAFKDRVKEIVSTDALLEGVEYADKVGNHGPLRLWHSGPASDIGTCDFQGVEGRFLIESGTFADTQLAHRAKAYFEQTDALPRRSDYLLTGQAGMKFLPSDAVEALALTNPFPFGCVFGHSSDLQRGRVRIRSWKVRTAMTTLLRHRCHVLISDMSRAESCPFRRVLDPHHSASDCPCPYLRGVNRTIRVVCTSPRRIYTPALFQRSSPFSCRTITHGQTSSLAGQPSRSLDSYGREDRPSHRLPVGTGLLPIRWALSCTHQSAYQA